MNLRKGRKKRSRNNESRQLFPEFLFKEKQRVGIAGGESCEFNEDEI